MPVVKRALGAVSDMSDQQIGKIGTTIRLKVLKKTALLETNRLRRNVR